MLRKPSPWLTRRVPAWVRRLRRARSAVLSAAAKVQLGQLVFEPESLAADLVTAARSRWLAGASLELVVARNIAAHGQQIVVAATHSAIDSLADEAWAERRLAVAAARSLGALGAVVAPLGLLAKLDASARPRSFYNRLSQHARLLERGIALSERSETRADLHSRHIVYFAAQSLPHHSSGYAIRTHGLVRNLIARGWDVSVHARFGYPNDRYDFLGVNLVDPAETVDGVRYHFEPAKRGYLGLDIESYNEAAASHLVRTAHKIRPALIHAASNYAVGLSGVEAARQLGIPSIYEVRGLWHMTRAAGQPEYADSDHYRLLESLEATAAKAADRALVITDAVGEVLRRRGVPADNIVVVPNAVDPDAFAMSDRDDGLARQWGVAGATVIGYIGSFKDYEGLDDLLRAAALLRSRGAGPFRVLLVGDGDVFQDLVDLGRELSLEDLVVFTGRQPHDRMPAFYSLMDIMAFPRRAVPLCQVVSPLKPFEAMATGAAVVASDVRALAEIVSDEHTGLLHRADDYVHLADQLQRLLGDVELRGRLATAAHQWVVQHRSWDRVVDGVDAVYRDLGAG